VDDTLPYSPPPDTSPVPPSDAQQPYSAQDLLAILEGDLESAAAIAADFAGVARRLDESLRDTLAAGNAEGLRAVAHEIKGMAANIGATTLSALGREVEQLARAGALSTPEMGSVHRRLLAALAQVGQALSSLRDAAA